MPVNLAGKLTGHGSYRKTSVEGPCSHPYMYIFDMAPLSIILTVAVSQKIKKQGPEVLEQATHNGLTLQPCRVGHAPHSATITVTSMQNGNHVALPQLTWNLRRSPLKRTAVSKEPFTGSMLVWRSVEPSYNHSI